MMGARMMNISGLASKLVTGKFRPSSYLTGKDKANRQKHYSWP